MHRLATLSALLLGLGVLSGCDKLRGPSQEPKQAMSPAQPAERPTPAPTPTSAARPGPPVRLPHNECQLDEYGITRKAIVIERNVRPLDRPVGGKLVGEPLKFFWPYFVFAIHDPPGGPAMYQVGDSPQKQSVKGWVSAETAVLWSTRVGAEYVLGYPLLIYRTKEALLELITTGATKEEPIARANPSGVRKWMPWPIAESVQFTHHGKTYELVRLLFLGEFKHGTDRAQPERPPQGSGGAGYSTTEIEALKRGVRKVRLAFVVDNTASTFPFLESILRAVQQIARRIKELPIQPEVSYGLVLYRDYVSAILFTGDDGQPSVVKVFPFTGDLDAFTRTVQPLRPATSGSEDWPEAVYDGIDAALTRLNWFDDKYSERVLVLIGDNSAHEPGHRKNPKNLSAAKLIEMAKERQVTLFSLCIQGGGGDAEQRLHWRQWETLAQGAGGKCYPIAQADKVVEEIRAILEERARKIAHRTTYLDERARGKTDAQVPLDERLRTEVVEFLTTRGIDVQRLGPGVPTFGTGWALMEVRGRPVLEKKVLIARLELSLLLGELNRLAAYLTAEDVHKVHDVAVRTRVGDRLDLRGLDPRTFFVDSRSATPHETMDIWLMKKGIPSTQGLLRLTRAEIDHMSEERRAALRHQLEHFYIEQLGKARNQRELFAYFNDLEYGWVRESLFP